MELYEILQKDPEMWDLFTRKEEYNSSFFDQFERFPYYVSSNRNIFEPRASKYLIEHGYHPEYPEEKPFAVCLTHDIDEVYTSLIKKKDKAEHYFRRGSFKGVMDSLSQMRSKKYPLWNFNDILAVEKLYGAKSSFYFMAENSGDQDYAYQIEDCETVLGDIIDNGCEVGLHGGHTTYSESGRNEIQEGAIWKRSFIKRLRVTGIIISGSKFRKHGNIYTRLVFSMMSPLDMLTV